MGIRKFRSVEAMPGPPVLPRLDPENLRIAFRLASLAAGLARSHPKPGLYKYHSWNEAIAAREACRHTPPKKI